MNSILESWTAREDKELRVLVAAGGTWEDIGKSLARTSRAVHSRAKKLRLSIKHIRWAAKERSISGDPRR